MITASVVLDRRYKRKDGLYPVRLRTTIRRGDKYLHKYKPTSYSMPLNEWDDFRKNLPDDLRWLEQNPIGQPIIPNNKDAPAAKGVYILYHDLEIVYVGWTGNIKRRLREHKWSHKVFTHISYILIQTDKECIELEFKILNEIRPMPKYNSLIRRPLP